MVSKFATNNSGSQPSLDLVSGFLTPERAAILEAIEDQNDDAKAELDLRPSFEEAVEENPEACPLRDFETTINILEKWGVIEEAGTWLRTGDPPQQTYNLTNKATRLFGSRGKIQTTAIRTNERDPGDWARNPVPPHLLSAELVSYVDSAVED